MNALAHQLHACLPDLAERTREQLFHLHSECTLDRCDRMVRALHEVMTVCRRLGAELHADDPPAV